MRPAIIEGLTCPFCGTRLRHDSFEQNPDHEIVYGVARCSCSTYPILEGILVLRRSFPVDEVVDLLTHGEFTSALGLALDDESQLMMRVGLWALSQGPATRMFGHLIRALSLWKAERTRIRLTKKVPLVSILRETPIERYYRHRFSTDSFWSVYALLPVLRRKSGVILDLGAGLGHSSYVLSTYLRPERLFSINYSFWELFLCRRFMAPDASLVQLDANLGLPFEDDSIDCFFALDCFHYLHSKLNLAREVERTLSPQGIFSLLHLHNSLQVNMAPGLPLSPMEWRNLFREIPPKLFAERRIVEDFVWRDQVELTQEHSESDLEQANALLLLGSRDETLFRRYGSVKSEFLKRRIGLRVNPLYTVSSQKSSLELTRCLPWESYPEEFPLSMKFLPEHLVLDDLTAIDDIAGKEAMAEDLIGRFVLLSLPEKYL